MCFDEGFGGGAVMDTSGQHFPRGWDEGSKRFSSARSSAWYSGVVGIFGVKDGVKLNEV